MTPSQESDSRPRGSLGPEGAVVPVLGSLRLVPGPEDGAIDVRVHVNKFDGLRLVIDTGTAFWLLDVSPAAAAYLAGQLAHAAGVTFE